MYTIYHVVGGVFDLPNAPNVGIDQGDHIYWNGAAVTNQDRSGDVLIGRAERVSGSMVRRLLTGRSNNGLVEIQDGARLGWNGVSSQ
jgi:hypothetical protein